MTDQPSDRLAAALGAPESSTRLQAAMAAGTTPHPDFLDPLVERCAVEPDFFVRDMLTWALTRLEPGPTVDRLLVELSSTVPQARSQALHTLSKIGDPRAFRAITPRLLFDDAIEVARAAWRAAAGLAPGEERATLAERLATQFARGDRGTQQSLSRALAVLGDAARPVVRAAQSHPDPRVAAHALATERVMDELDAESA